MINRLLPLLCRRFGLRWKCLPMARRNPQPFGPQSPFRTERGDDGCTYILPRPAR